MTILKKRKSETSKLAHLFKHLIVACLFMGQAFSSTISDRYLFRIESTVVGVHDLEVAHKNLEALFCRFPDSLLREWISENYLKKLDSTVVELKNLNKPLDKNHNLIIFISSTRQIYKLLNYLKGQEVNLDQSLIKSVSKVKGCPDVSWKKKPLRRSFEQWLRLEVYLRSRYAPTGIQMNPEWRKRRVDSVMMFVDSLDKQVAHENFW